MSLTRRLDALEQIAHDVQRRRMRDQLVALPEAHDLTPAEVEEAVDQALRWQAEDAQWLREGLTVREVMQRRAAEMGMTVEALEAECEQIIELTQRHD